MIAGVIYCMGNTGKANLAPNIATFHSRFLISSYRKSAIEIVEQIFVPECLPAFQTRSRNLECGS